MRGKELLQCVLAGAMGLALCGPANAQDWKATGVHVWFASGKAYEIEKGHLYWLGELGGAFINDRGTGTLLHMAGLKCPGVNDIDINNKKNRASGRCVFSDADGDQAYSTWQCEGDTATCSGTFDFTGGTGKYRAISGRNTFVSHTQVNWPDGTASGYSIWNR
jgi:hypothetical protein